MINFPNIDLEEYSYSLSTDKIASHPLERRDASRLLVVDKSAGDISHRQFSDLPDLIPEESLLVVNSTKVIQARIILKKQSGGRFELLLTEPLEPSRDPAIVMQTRGHCSWRCIVGGKRIKPGMTAEMKFGTYDAQILRVEIK
ncbi:MAG: S-adenosylmethionine:tRNA ribosyltransferase-isomerase, partial [Bacteroidota bacterium]|nr:S-adenosylmethionine:tRNA ribosyltransferase-isomerase [Bacteroidota bacterium]